jgi:regulator of protease activity HflC (stomatin/prohibitin superfamily)
MDLIERIEELQALIEEAKSLPLSSSAILNREELLHQLTQLKAEIPEEVRQARWLLRDKDDLIARAHKEAERVMTEAQGQRDRLLSRTEIVATAEREAERVLDEAKAKAAKLRIEAEDYIDQRLAEFEKVLRKTMGTVARGREHLGSEPAQQNEEIVVLTPEKGL